MSLSKITKLQRQKKNKVEPQSNIPFELPANLNAAKHRMIPNTSCVRTEWTFPCVGSGRSKDSREP